MKKLIFIFLFIPLLGGVRGGFSFAQDYDKNQTSKLKSGNSEIVIDDSKIQILIDDPENDIKIPVTNNSDQSPKLQPIKNTGDEGGQFIFIKK